MRTRHCRLRLEITVDNEARTYHVLPVRPLPTNTAQAFFLKNGDGKIYEVNVSMDGFVGCSCMGFDSSKHCKHVDSLTALGIINPEPFMITTRIQLELSIEREHIEEERIRIGKAHKQYQQFMDGKDIRCCYAQVAEQPVLQSDPPPKPPRRQRKPKSTDTNNGQAA